MNDNASERNCFEILPTPVHFLPIDIVEAAVSKAVRGVKASLESAQAVGSSLAAPSQHDTDLLEQLEATTVGIESIDSNKKLSYLRMAWHGRQARKLLQ